MSDDFRIPDYPAPIRAFRVWRVSFDISEMQLVDAVSFRMLGFDRFGSNAYAPLLALMNPSCSLSAWTHGSPWAPGWNKAVCLLHPDGSHEAPVFDCSCGHYAVPELGTVYGGAPQVDYHRRPWNDMVEVQIGVPGVVELRGRIIQHARGYRAEYARPIAILNPAAVSPIIEHTTPIYELIGALYGLHVTADEGLLEDIVREPDLYTNFPVANPGARLLLGGPAHGTMMTIPGTPATLRVPFDNAWNVEHNLPEHGNATYTRIGGSCYRYEETT